MTDKIRGVTVQQMREYLKLLGVETCADLEAERLYVVYVDIKYPELAKQVLGELDVLPHQSQNH
jgi:hypothetical protein